VTRAWLLLALVVAAGCKSEAAPTSTPADARDLPSDVSAETSADRVTDEPLDVPAELPPDVAEASVPEASPESAAVTCQSILAEYTRIVMAADRTCTAASDCVIEGDSNLSCQPGLLSIGCGVAVNTRAFPTAQVDGLRNAASRLGCRLGNWDCGQWDPVCTGGRCTVMHIRGCLPGPEPSRDGG
jgi:hypothetical protein